MRSFIIAERTSDFNLHQILLKQILNIFAASWHNYYAKSARLYLHLMLDLPFTLSWLSEQHSSNRFHSVRRSDKFWARLSADLAIKQVKMRAVKSRGGLTYGLGMWNSVRFMWVGSMHRGATVHLALVTLTNLKFSFAYYTSNEITQWH